MKFKKQDILAVLKTITVPGAGENMVDSGAVTNVLTFGDEVIVDITIKNPTLQARKKTESEIKTVVLMVNAASLTASEYVILV